MGPGTLCHGDVYKPGPRLGKAEGRDLTGSESPAGLATPHADNMSQQSGDCVYEQQRLAAHTNPQGALVAASILLLNLTFLLWPTLTWNHTGRDFILAKLTSHRTTT